MKSVSRSVIAAVALMSALPAVHGQQNRARSAGVAMKEASYLGIGVEDVNSDRAGKLKLKDERGAYVTSVMQDTPALKAGIKEGDVILEFNNQRVDGKDQLIKMVRETPAGKSVKVVLWRNGASMSLWATVESHKVIESDDGSWSLDMPPMPNLPSDFKIPPIDIPKMITVMQNPMLGIEGEGLAKQPQLAEFFGVKDGVLVKSVEKGSASERAGMKAGDVLAKIGDNRISAWRDLAGALRYTQPGKPFPVIVVRGKKEIPLTVTVEDGR